MTDFARPRGGRASLLRMFHAGPFAVVLALGGCASLPISGPTGSQIVKQQQDPKSGFRFSVVELTDFSALPQAATLAPIPAFGALPPPTDIIGSGDVLDIVVYETGVTLFAGGSAGGHNTAADLTPPAGINDAAQATRLPPLRVDDAGDIRIPYAGKLRAAGRTPLELQAAIRLALRGMSQNPQILVSLEQSITNSVVVGGEVTKAGRLVLQTNRETLSEAIALAGGYRGLAKDLTVRISRSGQALEYRLSDVLSGPARDMRVMPGDHIEIVSQPLSFSVMGAPGKVEQMPFSSSSMSLAEAVAQAGGANPNLGDAKAIFVFRLVPAADGTEEAVVYHVNMMQAGALFLSQRFAMQDKDVLYIGNAAANQPSKLIQLVSQLFSPVVAVSSGLAAVKQ